jgi:hypothetical protein
MGQNGPKIGGREYLKSIKYLLQNIHLIGLGGFDGGWRMERHDAFSAG